MNDLEYSIEGGSWISQEDFDKFRETKAWEIANVRSRTVRTKDNLLEQFEMWAMGLNQPPLGLTRAVELEIVPKDFIAIQDAIKEKEIKDWSIKAYVGEGLVLEKDLIEIKLKVKW